MKIIKTDFEGLFVVEPKIFGDARGYFFESYSEREMAKAGIDTVFVQDNQSFSSYGVIRGLHFQQPPYAQTKLIRVLDGVINDVVVDLRVGSPTFGRHFSIELSSENHKQLYIPKGFAHGFSVLSIQASVAYKCDELYHPESEAGIRYSDMHLGIDWKVDPALALISAKDTALPLFKDFDTPFTFKQ